MLIAFNNLLYPIIRPYTITITMISITISYVIDQS